MDTPSQLEAHATDPLLGTTLAGKWTLDAVLGGGGAAVVYAATHRNGNRVAIKVLRPHLLGTPDVVQRFRREGHVGNRVSHPGVVKALDDGTTDDGLPYLVMERLEGESLDRRLAREGRLEASEALRVVDVVLDMLVAAHACGLVHRDIKPENVFLTVEGTVKLLDFGIAGSRAPGQSGQTLLGMVLGTPAFMAPEQARGRWDEVDARSDLWSVGATLFVAMTGRWLRTGETPAEELLSAMSPVAPMAAIAPEIPPGVAAVLDRALSHAAEARFASARDMQTALRRAAVSSSPPVGQRETSPPSTLPRAVAWVGLSAAALACTVLGAGFVGREARRHGAMVTSEPATPALVESAAPVISLSPDPPPAGDAGPSASPSGAASPVPHAPRAPRAASHKNADPLGSRF